MRMRVIAGELGGRLFEAPQGSVTHPMAERVRGALFNSLGDISGMSVLDAFSGTGALGFEAISRGAARAVLVEKDRRAQQTIARNIEQLGLQDRVTLVRASAQIWSEAHTGEQFDIVLCDPPYDKMQLSTVSDLVRHVNKNGLMVLSYPGRESAPTVNGVVVVDKSKSYGDAALAFYRLAAN